MIACVVPCYREPIDRVRRTIESIVAVENIDHVVIVDDGCNDDALDSLRSLALDDRTITVLHLPENVGPAAAMNRGAEFAIDHGEVVICRLDVGDVFRHDAKRRQLALMSDVPAVCSPHFNLVTNEVYQPLAHWRRQIYWDGAFCICTIAVTAETWLAVGGFDETLRYGDDWDFAMRVEHAVGWTMFDEVTCEAGAFEDGHSRSADADPVKRRLKHECLKRVLATGRRLRGRP